MFGFIYNGVSKRVSDYAMKYMQENFLRKPLPYTGSNTEEILRWAEPAQAGDPEAAWELGKAYAKQHSLSAFYWLNRGKEYLSPQEAYFLGACFIHDDYKNAGFP